MDVVFDCAVLGLGSVGPFWVFPMIISSVAVFVIIFVVLGGDPCCFWRLEEAMGLWVGESIC